MGDPTAIIENNHSVGIFRPQRGSLATLCSNLAKNVKNSSKNVDFCSDGRPNSCYISNQPLYFLQMAITKILGHKRGFDHKSDPNWPKNVKKSPTSSLSALAGGSTAIK